MGYLLLIISLLITTPQYEGTEMVWNIWVDTQTTNLGILDNRYYEGNPYWNKIFIITGYKNVKYVNAVYIVSMATLTRVIPAPYNSLIFAKIYGLYAFMGAYTWRNTGYLKYPIKLTLLRIEW